MNQTKKQPEGAHEVHLPDRAEEARNLAKEGVEELQHGDKEEGKFLIDEARAMDKAAADQVVKESK